MLKLDSLVLDLIFAADKPPAPDSLIAAMGGEEEAKKLQLFDPDANDPRIEMQVSPSIPLRRRGERRLMIIDDAVAPMRDDPRQDAIVPIDLRPAKQRIIDMVEATNARIGRVFALGTWGDAVIVVRSARDLRAIMLMAWVLDPSIDVDGNRLAGQPTQKDIEAKINAYDLRLDELDEKQILADLGPAKFERHGDLLVFDVLENDGTWDVRKSLAMELSVAAIDRFSRIPGAPAGPAGTEPPPPTSQSRPEPVLSGVEGRSDVREAHAAESKDPTPAPAPAKGPPLSARERGSRVVLVFPPERWDVEVAAAMGKKDWDQVVRSSDPIPGATKDNMYQHGAGFLAPLEFLSEVFVDGKPLSKPQFEQASDDAGGGVRTMHVHFPRYGSALLLQTERGRFVTSELDAGADILSLLD